MPPWTERAASSLARRPAVLFASLYAAIGVLAWLVRPALPAPLAAAVRALTGSRGLGAFDPSALGRAGAAPVAPAAELWAIAATAMLAAGILALPVAWLYTITRQKRGYRQSVVHSLVLLPVIVAGVVVLVKHSLALAFSLAGIVAAVRFRNTLEDSKDAVFIFVATGIGLAAGVELSVALTLSLLFNLATLLLFHSDFGRTPARLEGEMAEQRMRRALAVANRTSQFVARLDREVFEDMAPEQLEAVADRARSRRRAATGAGPQEAPAPAPDAALRVRTDGSHQAREAVEAALGRHAKRWRFLAVETAEGGGQVLRYTLRLRKSVLPRWFVEAVRTDGGAGVLEVELT